MPRVPDRHYGFSGGLNTRDSITELGPRYLSDTRNIKYDPSGAAVTRGGYAKVTSSGALSSHAVTSGKEFKLGTTTYNLAFSNQTMYKISAGAGSSMDTTAFTADTTFTFATLYANVYYCNGVEAARKWTGTGNASAMGGSPPTAKYYTTSSTAQRLFAAGDTSNPQRLYFSALGNAEDWTTANDAGFIDVLTEDGEAITGIKEINGVLAVFKTYTTHVLTGVDPKSFSLKRVSSKVGCVAPYSIAASERELFCASSDGFYAFNGASFRRVSELILPSYRALASVTGIKGAIYKNTYVASVTVTTSYDRLFVYDYRISKEGAWTIHDSHSANSLWEGVAGAEKLYFGGPTGHVYQYDSGTTDDGSGVSWFFQTPWLSLKQPERKKKWKRIHVLAEPTGSYTISVTSFFDWSSSGPAAQTINLSPSAALWGSFTWGSANWGSSEQAKHYILSTPQKADSVMYKFSGSNPSKIFGFTVITKPKHIK